jgi:hypothetical protein
MEKRPWIGRCIRFGDPQLNGRERTSPAQRIFSLTTDFADIVGGRENSRDQRSESCPPLKWLRHLSVAATMPCGRIYAEGPSQIEFTKQGRILGLAQFWQHACPFAVALQ